MKRHWYSLEIAYQQYSRTLFSQTECVGVISQSDIIRHRTLRKHLGKRFVHHPDVRKLLCNGELRITVLAYLGKFDGDAPTIREYITERFGTWAMDYFIHSKTL